MLIQLGYAALPYIALAFPISAIAASDRVTCSSDEILSSAEEIVFTMWASGAITKAVKSGVSKEEAEKIAKEIEGAGGKAEIK